MYGPYHPLYARHLMFEQAVYREALRDLQQSAAVPDEPRRKTTMYGYPYILTSRPLRTQDPLTGSRLYSPYRFEPGEPDSDDASTPRSAFVALLVVYVLVIGLVLAAISFSGPSAASDQAKRIDTGCHRAPGLWSGCLPTK